MSATIRLQADARELSYRESDGIQVQLLWIPASDALSVLVTDTRTGECFELDAPGTHALDVFDHPFAYATYTQCSPAASGGFSLTTRKEQEDAA
jgi:hypothetical protein